MVIVVADGAGGMGGGGRAADLGVKTILDSIEAGSLDGLSSEACVALLRKADALVTEEREAGETTMVLVAVTAEGRVVGASCGDSGALIVTAGGWLDDVTEGQSRWRLGSGRAEPVGFERPALRGTLLVATDGLLAYVRPDTLIGLVERHDAVDAAASALAQAAKLPRGGLQDDLALVVLRED